jgi:hypothetical protein
VGSAQLTKRRGRTLNRMRGFFIDLIVSQGSHLVARNLGGQKMGRVTRALVRGK